MSAMGHKRTNHRGPKSTFVRCSPIADIGQCSRHSESAANLLMGNGANFDIFSECALILQANWLDFDTAILADDDSQALITARPFGGTLVAKGVTIPWKDSVSHFLLSYCFYDGGGVLSGPPTKSMSYESFSQTNVS